MSSGLRKAASVASLSSPLLKARFVQHFRVDLGSPTARAVHVEISW